MNYNVGQFIVPANGDVGSYYTDIGYTIGTITTNQGISYTNSIIKANNSFTIGATYYLKIHAKSSLKERNVTIKLIKDEDVNNYTIINKVTFLSNQEDELEFSFTPITECNTILFQLERNENNLNDVFEFNRSQLCSVTNLLNNLSDNSNLIQVGIQSEQGALFILNGETFKMNKSGIYETPEGYEISNIGVIPKGNPHSPYIIDYRY